MKNFLKTVLVSVSALLLLFTLACNKDKNAEPVKKEQKEVVKKSGVIMKENMDLTVAPGKDFYTYSNGGWMKNNPLPDDKSRFGSFDQLAESNNKQIKGLINEISKGTHAKGSIEEKIQTLYNQGMDMETINKLGMKPVEKYLEEIRSVKDKKDLMNIVIKFHKSGISSLFNFFPSQDSKNSSMVLAHLYQGGLGLSDRDYYVKKNKRAETLRKGYVELIEKLLVLSGKKAEDAKVWAKDIMAFETELAKASMTRLETRDPHKIYNKVQLDKLSKDYSNTGWDLYFKGIGLDEKSDVILCQPLFFAQVDKMIKNTSAETWKKYLTWKLVKSCSNYLGSDFINANFDFYGKIVSGQKKDVPRWKKVLRTTQYAMSEAIGQMYVKKYFPPRAKKRMKNLVENLRASLEERIGMLDWMSKETKVKAVDKLKGMRVKIGYPDKWKDYSELKIEKDSYLANVLRSRAFKFNYSLSKVNKPVDKSEWHMPPQMVNAYYDPNNNEICFPAGILQPPFFYLDADDAVNYGAIGVVIGHEMTHGFDDQGRLFDKEGNLNNWWTKEDSENFKKRADVLVNQFNNFIVLGDVHADGKLSLGENIADLGGLNISYNAFRHAFKKNPVTEKIEGFTPDQRFFLAYSYVWAQNVTDKEMLRRTKEDVHSLGRFRVNGPLSNLPAFYKAFGIKKGDTLFRDEKERAVIW